MNAYVIRSIKRFAVLIPGLVGAYIAVHNIFPRVDRTVDRYHKIDKYFPGDAIAILLTYIIAAYILIPAIFRLIRFLVKPKHIPMYCITPDGFASDPLNIGLIGTEQELTKAMAAAGWYLADSHTPKNVAKEIWALIFRRPYPNAPVSSLNLFGRKQDIAFQLPVNNDPHQRHHVRFWALKFEVEPRYEKDLLFWERHLTNLKPGHYLWLGAISLDTGLRPIRHNAQMTHLIDPDTNGERDLLVEQLNKNQQVKACRTVVLGKAYSLRNRAITGYFHADGKMTICELV